MARKDPSQWSDAYRKRFERAAAKAAREGRTISRQEMRGHGGPVPEHIQRATRARLEGRETSAEKEARKRWERREAAFVSHVAQVPEERDRWYALPLEERKKLVDMAARRRTAPKPGSPADPGFGDKRTWRFFYRARRSPRKKAA
jgi:hypothetical protein